MPDVNLLHPAFLFFCVLKTVNTVVAAAYSCGAITTVF